jgi:hypothetical protein
VRRAKLKIFLARKRRRKNLKRIKVECCRMDTLLIRLRCKIKNKLVLLSMREVLGNDVRRASGKLPLERRKTLFLNLDYYFSMAYHETDEKLDVIQQVCVLQFS